VTSFLTSSLVLLGIVMAVMLVLWWISLRLRDASIVDIFWGPGFVLTAAAALARGGAEPRRLLLMALVLAWGARLGFHIFRRNRGKEEDFRYREMRSRHGQRFWLVSLFTVFGLQGLLLWIIAQPLAAVMLLPGSADWSAWDAVGLTLWGVGFAFEAVGDEQLRRFKTDPANAGTVMRSGLWGWTRHPNYFGDAVQWWGFFAFAAGVPGGAWTVFSPLLMTFLLLRVSGVAMLDRALIDRKPGYAEYVRSTSAFVPWFPKARPPTS
jgi:steroid 5-alpha reductase family enzyme